MSSVFSPIPSVPRRIIKSESIWIYEPNAQFWNGVSEPKPSSVVDRSALGHALSKLYRTSYHNLRSPILQARDCSEECLTKVLGACRPCLLIANDFDVNL